MNQAGSMPDALRALLLATLVALVAGVAGAQDQTLQPDAENNPADIFNDACTTTCDSAACDDDVDEGQGAADGHVTSQRWTIQESERSNLADSCLMSCSIDSGK